MLRGINVQAAIKMVGLGNYGRSDLSSAVIEEARIMGSQADLIVEEGEVENFNQGLIDWKKVLNSTHWLVLSSSGSLEGQSMKSAWGSSMTFAELEGCKTVMIVEPPGDPNTKNKSPFESSTIVGVIELSILLLGSIEFASFPIKPQVLG